MTPRAHLEKPISSLYGFFEIVAAFFWYTLNASDALGWQVFLKWLGLISWQPRYHLVTFPSAN
jgi:hypothetical protein